MPDPPDPTRFVLMHTSHAGNKQPRRAMKVMALPTWCCWLRLADVLCHEEAVVMASGAFDILASGAHRVHAGRGAGRHPAGLRHGDDAARLRPADRGCRARICRGCKPPASATAFVFGLKRVGLGNDDVYRRHACLSIPTDARYGSLNLAQAVQLIAYEWRMALGGFTVQPAARPRRRWPTCVRCKGPSSTGARALVQIGFLDPAALKKLVPRLQQLLNRAQLSDEEVHILRGIARAVQRRD